MVSTTVTVLQTGLKTCYDSDGQQTACNGSGQDAEFQRGIKWNNQRFEAGQAIVHDHQTGLTWTQDANPAQFPLDWTEALAFIRKMNKNRAFGYSDWRLPNRVELRSLVDLGTTRPVISPDAPFKNIEQSWYWSSTTAAISPDHAWYIEMSGGRMFFGHKQQFFLTWPVRGKSNGILRKSGQTRCYDAGGHVIPCPDSGQDGETRFGAEWPFPRFEAQGDDIHDRLTDLVWYRHADLSRGPVNWQQALDTVQDLETSTQSGWRLPNINELESLVDCQRHSPALAEGHPFLSFHDTCWSSTTSLYQPDWSFALYFNKGAIGVGHKRAAGFHVWPVREKRR